MLTCFLVRKINMLNVDNAARKGLESQSKDYYPTIDELIEEDVSTVSKHPDKNAKSLSHFPLLRFISPTQNHT